MIWRSCESVSPEPHFNTPKEEQLLKFPWKISGQEESSGTVFSPRPKRTLTSSPSLRFMLFSGMTTSAVQESGPIFVLTSHLPFHSLPEGSSCQFTPSTRFALSASTVWSTIRWSVWTPDGEKANMKNGNGFFSSRAIRGARRISKLSPSHKELSCSVNLSAILLMFDS